MRDGRARGTYSEEAARWRRDSERRAGRSDGAEFPSRSNAPGLPRTDQWSAGQTGREKKSQGPGAERAGEEEPGGQGRGREEELGDWAGRTGEWEEPGSRDWADRPIAPRGECRVLWRKRRRLAAPWELEPDYKARPLGARGQDMLARDIHREGVTFLASQFPQL